MIRLSLIAIYLLTLCVYNCEDIKLYQSGSVFSEECQTRINAKEYRCKQTISEQWGCNFNATTKQLHCYSLAQNCCASHQITECVKPKVEELCGEHMVASYVDHRRKMFSQCPQHVDVGLKCEKSLADIKVCYEKITPKDAQCSTSADQNWNCIPDCSNDVKRYCCSRWQYYDCVSEEAENNCEDFAFKEVFAPFLGDQLIALAESICKNYTYGSIHCKKQIVSSTKRGVTVNVVTTASVTKVSVTPSQTKPDGTHPDRDSDTTTVTHNTSPDVIIDSTLPVITFTTKKHEITPKKSEQKKPWNIVIIVVVILLLLIIIGAILVICCGLCRTRKKSEDITETQQSEHNQQNNGETGEEEGKSAEELTTLRTIDSSSVDNESDSQLDQTVK